jgi:peptide/nickel transport system substrate-binding protein
MRTFEKTILSVTVLAGALSLGAARAQHLTLAVGAAPTSVDPHYHLLTPNLSLSAHIFDALVAHDEKDRLVPSLALSWKLIADDTWEFRLRPGVKFHDGTAFTAEDVAYTIARVPTVANSPGSFAIYTKPVTGVEVVDATTIRLKTKDIYPLLPSDLAQVKMLPHGLGPAPATEDFNNGKNAIGTGAYRITAFRPGDRAELVRNDAFWGPKPYWQTVTYRFIPNDGARTAALLAGDVDFIEAVPTTDAARLRTDKRVHLAEANSARIVFLWLDRSRQGPTPFVTGPNGEKLDKNPLNDLRVRQALSIAINRQAIVERVMENAAIPSGQFLAPGSYSYVPGLNPPVFDPQKAKALLAEAGFSSGLRITLHGPNDRYVNDAKIIQAVGQMWTRIGVQTTVEPLTWPAFIGRANKQEFSAFLLGWGIDSGEASNPLRALIHTPDKALGWGSANRPQYSNPAIDALTVKALATGDDAAREKILQQATRMAMEDVAFIPLHIQKNIWGMKPGLTYVARTDEETHAMDLRPAK